MMAGCSHSLAVVQGLESRVLLSGTHFVHTTAALSQARSIAGATAVNGLALFAGGFAGEFVNDGLSDRVDVYDARTGRWSTAGLSAGRYQVGAATVGTLALFAGGEYNDRHGRHASAVVDVYDARSGEWSTTALAEPRAGLAGAAVGDTALLAGGYVPSPFGGTGGVLDTVDVFTPDDVAPTPALVSAPTLGRSAKTYTFTVSYHDRYGIDRSTVDDGDVFVTGPGGFDRAAALVSQTRGKHGSTREVTYAVRGRGLRWDATENGTYTMRLHGRQVRDVAGNPAAGDDLGVFSVAIATGVRAAELSPPLSFAGVFHAGRSIDELLGGA